MLSTIDVGLSPLDLAWNPAQNRVYVANFDGSSISVLRDSVGGVEESFEPQIAGRKLEATLVRGVLVLGAVGSRLNTACRAELLDAAGRAVMTLQPGANDVRALAPGVYFVRAVSGKLSAVGCHKVVTAK